VLSESAQTRLEALVAPLRADPGSAAILSDIDGTLAPIVERPETAVVPDAARTALEKLAGEFALVACVSGRRAADARRLVGVDGILYAGNHGFELLLPGDSEPRPDPALGNRAGAALEFARTLDARELAAAELRLEDKGPIQAIHWRGAADGEHARAMALSIAAAAQAAGLVPRWGRKVLELRPVAGIDKGSVVTRLIRERDLGQALFGGDDDTDLDAFQALRWMERSGRLERGICVGVDSEEAPAELPERSDIVVDGTGGYLEVLNLLMG
jgi:trehalose 6-phosphate phosphatase